MQITIMTKHSSDIMEGSSNWFAKCSNMLNWTGSVEIVKPYNGIPPSNVNILEAVAVVHVVRG